MYISAGYGTPEWAGARCERYSVSYAKFRVHTSGHTPTDGKKNHFKNEEKNNNKKNT